MSSQNSGPVRRERLADVEPQGVGLAVLDPPGAFVRVEVAADAGIERLAGRPVRRPARLVDLHPDLPARAEAGIDHAQPAQLVQGRLVDVDMLGLAADLAVPVDAEPGQVLVDALLELRPAALAVDVLDPQQEAPARIARRLVAEQGRVGVTQMEVAARARREARHLRRLALGRDGEEIAALDHAGPAGPRLWAATSRVERSLEQDHDRRRGAAQCPDYHRQEPTWPSSAGPASGRAPAARRASS